LIARVDYLKKPVIFLSLMEGSSKKFKSLEERVERLERAWRTLHRLDEAEAIMAEEKPPFDCGNQVTLKGGMSGIVVHYVNVCDGYCLYIRKHKRYIFVPSEDILNVTKQYAAYPMESEIGMQFAKHDSVMVKLNTVHSAWRQSRQLGKILKVYSSTKQYLVELLGFDEREAKEGFEMVDASNVHKLPEVQVARDSLKQDHIVWVDNGVFHGYWKAVVVGILDDKPVIRYLNKEKPQELIVVNPDDETIKIYAF